VILGRWRQMPGHNILPDLIADSRKRAVVFDPDLLEPLLPVGSLQAEFFACTERESALDELDGTLDSHAARNCDEEMNVIRRDDKLVQAVLLLCLIGVEDVDEQRCCKIGLRRGLRFPEIQEVTKNVRAFEIV